MAPAIIAVAETAQDVAAALQKFVDPVDDQAAEITALMAECLSTSSALRELDRTIGPFPHHRHYPEISEDLTIVKDSLTYTFEDVKRLFGRLGRVAAVPRAEYIYVWDDLCDYFRTESGNTLRRRLRICCIVLDGLTDTLIEGLPRDLEDFDKLMDKLVRLEKEQHAKFVEAFDGLDVGGPVINRPTSFERRRPRDDQVPPLREEPLDERITPLGREPLDPRGGGRDNNRPPDREDYFDRPPRRPPFAPDLPGSPTTSNTFSTHSSNLDSVLSSHWLPEVFNLSQPSTKIRDTGQTSVFLASPMPGSSTRLEERGYVNLLEIPFENGDLLMRLYQRSHDCRSRFLCRTVRPARSRKDVVLPLVSLIVERSGPFLKFLDIGEGHPQLWALLKFPSYEFLVLLFCSFIALRSEDIKTPFGKILDFEIHKEKEWFAGRIVDDHYEHALRLFREKDTGVIRLQASVQKGFLKRKPIWTAFITHQILSPTWLSRVSSRVVHLAELQRYVFTDDYNPQKTASGAHELTFIDANDAKEFVKMIKELVRKQKEKRKR